ncbi:MAG: zinc-binding dehydrogenase [Vulcanimicrobiaceae bacterium]
MKAAIFHGSGKRLVVEDREMPKAGTGEIVIQVAACGICHTDLHYLDHGVPTFAKPPLILGHEISGTISEVGAGSERWKLGDSVLIPAVLSCGKCRMCRIGRENLCEKSTMLGNHIDGGFAEYICVPEKDVVRLPPELPLEEACLIADAVSTPYHAVIHRGEVTLGDRVVVFGCGGVGINVIQVAAAVGAEIWAVDTRPDRLALAEKFGANHLVDASSAQDVVRNLRRETDGGCDVAFEVIGKPQTIRNALDCVRRGGRVVVVGFSSEAVEMPAGKIMFSELEIRGSLGCRPVDYPRIIELVRTKKLRLTELVTGRVALTDINAGLDTLRKGEGLRTIVIPSMLRGGSS